MYGAFTCECALGASALPFLFSTQIDFCFILCFLNDSLLYSVSYLFVLFSMAELNIFKSYSRHTMQTTANHTLPPQPTSGPRPPSSAHLRPMSSLPSPPQAHALALWSPTPPCISPLCLPGLLQLEILFLSSFLREYSVITSVVHNCCLKGGHEIRGRLFTGKV